MESARGWLILAFIFVAVAGFSSGCGPAPPCETSLVTLDETRLDAETYEPTSGAISTQSRTNPPSSRRRSTN